MSRFAYEQSVFAEIASEQVLTLEEFLALPAYIDRVSSHDTWYDGRIVRIEVKQPTLAAAGETLIEVLGPYWDRIFQCRFHEVSKIEAVGINMIGIPEIHGVSLERLGEDHVCAFRTYNKDQELRVTFKIGDVTRLMLRTPLERVQIGS